MKSCIITFRSVTPAQRGEGLLRRAGVDCSIQRTPKWMEAQGCGYSLRVKCRDLPAAVALLKEEQVPYRKLYERSENRTLAEVQL